MEQDVILFHSGKLIFNGPNPDKPEPNRVISEKLDDLQIALKPALGAAFSDLSKISCQEWQQFHDKVSKADRFSLNPTGAAGGSFTANLQQTDPP